MDDIKTQESKPPIDSASKPPLQQSSHTSQISLKTDLKLESDLGDLQKRIAGLEKKIGSDVKKES